MNGRFVRLAEQGRKTFAITVDGVVREAAEGDTLMVALLTGMNTLRDSEFGDGRRAGFCLMGACQDCWVWTAAGERVRACSTPAAPGMSIVTKLAEAGEGVWPRA
ncbi:(2Fe-2S)-binding protein [Paraburkholderia sp. 22099]|jgi:aerobic-type carbon monoxide dehydrogenase small subunit (CoxS/CutS family)|uniref:2Fe-2S iron-sulfur cluster binding domain-containing protein n=1 Tax=Paraburkholderia terricola TaxID=169427 RepID=A0A1M6N3W5_9BURK|nr:MULTISPECIES: (2Fe-2S)-binding protein [Paraburkholderia]ORC51678.1 NAD(FAD)-dependent dehydrogenase [Burkholderia sp. A27]AXE95845.1 NAD(FAD)-dependent dehydrogenase [Paraburkholderia terricola]MDR6407138.1 aerobic-type carbon monoxide dehydrogenase small subunit (CoxS/CutS family) [Paraburkholderia terricola]MDR6445323.1 aerobic-type carbon monoxide dehydrogenase small subunit (CoxS/CutS family) [Paraburkholderia terricola]MDR6479184.1 aerobic-type carbon monoxide dehydrogenase small subu